jgi:phosphoribosylanthranilate isomerase
MMVKICGITRREDAEAAAAAGADALGFVFYPKSPRYVTPERAAELGSGLAPWKVGVFVDETAASIEAVMRAAKLDVAQVYSGDAPRGARLWKAFRLSGPFDPALAGDAEAVLLDGPANGIAFDWKNCGPCPAKVIIAGGLNPANVQEAISLLRPWGVDASSGLESAPGIKDSDKIRHFVDAAKGAQ